MKVLILSCNTGQGHNSVARAIQEEMETRRISCEIVDVLQFISPRWSEWISKGHSWIYCHHPELFSWGYEKAEQHPDYLAQDTPLYHFFAKGVPGLRECCTTGGYDVVICVHVFAALMLTELRKQSSLDAWTCFVDTDYTCSPGTLSSRLDHYFAPHASLCDEFRGVPVSVSGIPVRRAFYQSVERVEAKRGCGIDPAHRHVLMMGGSMGCGPVEDAARLLAAQMPPEVELSIVCGRNEELYRQLETELDGCPGVHLYGYTDQIPLLMDSAELCVTKPGGISVTEAMVKGLPMLLVNAVAGCESYNLEFMIRLGGAESAETPEEIAAHCLTLLADEPRREQMALVLRAARCNAAEQICDAIQNNLSIGDKGKTELKMW